MSKSKYEVAQPILIGKSQRKEIGSTVSVPDDLTEAEANRLRKMRPPRLVPVGTHQPEEPTEGEIEQKLAEAIQDLHATAAEGTVTVDGKPTVEAIEEMTGIKITAEQRDEIFAHVVD